MRVEEKTKRRCRRVKRVRSKMRFTVLRVVEVGVRVPEGGEVGLASEEEGVGAGKGRVRKGKRGGDGGRKRVGGVERKTRWKSLDLAFATQAAGEEVENTVSRSVDLGSRRFKEEVADGEH